MIDKIKELFLSKIFLRVAYITGAFAASHAIALISQPSVQTYLSKTGLSITVTDPETLKTWITGLLLIVGEFIYRWTHTKVILPVVKPPEAKP